MNDNENESPRDHGGGGFADWANEEARAAREGGRSPDARLDGILRRTAGQVPERTALVGPDRRWTYVELDAEVDVTARGLRSAGILPGDRILVQLGDGAAFVVVWSALLRAGAVPVHAMPGHRVMELVHLATGSGARGVLVGECVAGADGPALAAEVRTACSGIDLVIVHGPRRAAGLLTWEQIRELGQSAGPDVVDRAPVLMRLDPIAHDGDSSPALLLHSGGTTGLPKLIPRFHAEYAYNAWAAARASGVGADTVLLAVLPTSYNFTLACPGVLGVLRAGGTVVVAPDRNPATAFALVVRERVTHVPLTPTLARAWLDEAARSSADLSSLRVVQVGGARLDDVTARALEPALGVVVQQVYGMAEGLICMTALDDPPEVRWSTQGRPISPDDRLRVRAADGVVAAEGAPGELETRGPCILRAYHAAPEADATSFTADGFYRTGDIVRLLPSGHVVVTGRAKDQVNRGGEKYAAAEVERYLQAMPSVRAAAVVPVRDRDLGERAVAVVAGGADAPDRDAVVAHLRALGVAEYKHPDRVVVLHELPLTAVGKVDKAALAAMMNGGSAPAGERAAPHRSGLT